MADEFKVGDKSLSCNFANPAFMKKVEDAFLNFAKTQDECEKKEKRTYAQVIEDGCNMCERVFDDIWGEGTAANLFPEKDLSEYEEAIYAFLSFMDEAKARILNRRAKSIQKYLEIAQ